MNTRFVVYSATTACGVLNANGEITFTVTNYDYGVCWGGGGSLTLTGIPCGGGPYIQWQMLNDSSQGCSFSRSDYEGNTAWLLQYLGTCGVLPTNSHFYSPVPPTAVCSSAACRSITRTWWFVIFSCHQQLCIYNICIGIAHCYKLLTQSFMPNVFEDLEIGLFEFFWQLDLLNYSAKYIGLARLVPDWYP